MRSLAFILTLAFTVFSPGCYRCVREELNPPRPAHLRGWQSMRWEGVTYTAEFLLKPGERVENDKFGIEVVKIIPPQKCSGYLAEAKWVEVVIRFYRVPENETLLERKFTGLGSTIFREHLIQQPPYNVVGLSVDKVNTKEGWVSFNLIG